LLAHVALMAPRPAPAYFGEKRPGQEGSDKLTLEG
jgi:hypothetical protein